MPVKCIFILSTKSAGSTVLQRHLAATTGASLAPKTRHYENETLYWTKAASVLGLPQVKLPNSEVPISRNKAARELARFLSENLGQAVGAPRDKTEIFRGWTRVCEASAPIVLEKSPHHLYQPAVIDLMLEYADSARTVDVFFVGLVRNPMDTLYSTWRRFGVNPTIEEAHWTRAYKTLLDLKRRAGDRICIVRYEDLLVDDSILAPLFLFAGRTAVSVGYEPAPFHHKSVHKWRNDSGYGFSLGPEAANLAAAFGYDAGELENSHSAPWFIRRAPRAMVYRFVRFVPRPILDPLSQLKRRLQGPQGEASGARPSPPPNAVT